MKRFRLWFFVFLGVMFMLVSCSSMPGESDVRKAVMQYLGRLSNHPQEIFSVKNVKILGRRKVGEDAYIVRAEYDIVFKKGWDEIQRTEKIGFLKGMVWGMIADYCGGIKKNEVCHFVDKFKFVKGEDGWMVVEQGR